MSKEVRNVNNNNNARNLQLLVCSANLGNEQPDNESLSYWIPYDGSCFEVFRPSSEEDNSNNNNDNNNSNNDVSTKTSSNPNHKYPIRLRRDLPPTYNGTGTLSSTRKDAYDGTGRLCSTRNVATCRDRQSPGALPEVSGLEIQDDFADCKEDDQFDIIVIGMQEATFDPPTLGKGGGGFVNDANNSDATLKDNDSSGRIRVNIPIVKPLKKIPKTIQRLHSLVGQSRDHAPKYQHQSSDIENNNNDKNDELTTNKEHDCSSCILSDQSERSGASESQNNNISKRTITIGGTAQLLVGAVAQSHKAILRKVCALEILPTEWLDGTPVLHAMIDARLPCYYRAISYQRGQMRLEVYVHKSQVQVDVINVAAQNTGKAGLANKGGIIGEVLVNGRTKLSFLTAHLEAHEGQAKYQIRCKTIADILDGTKQQKTLPDVSCTSHYSFFMGDLNFRTELPDCNTLSEEDHKQQVRDLVVEQNWERLNEIDELGRALKNKECLVGFQTPFCNFPPTFKVERQRGFAYIDKRRPSYTDRILWKTGHELEKKVQPLIYEPIESFASSDHKPIRCAFSIQLNEPYVLRPKMVRGGSAIIRRRSSQKKIVFKGNLGTADSNLVAHKERLHLFLTDMRCEISCDNKQVSNSPPDPYICLVTDPEAALRFDVQKRWALVKSKVLRKMRQSHGLPMKGELTKTGWPRSSIQKQTFNPDWELEEIHVELNTHGKDGSPIDLTGAVLHICVMDNRGKVTSGDTVLLGSFSFNLMNLIRACRTSSQESSRRILNTRMLSNKNNRRQSGSIEENRSSQRNSANTRNRRTEENNGSQRSSANTRSWRMSTMNKAKSFMGSMFFARSLDIDHDEDVLDDDEDLIVTVEVDEPLVLNGVETGRICCRVEAWWMDEKTASAFGLLSRSARASANKPRNTSAESQIQAVRKEIYVG